MSMRIFSLALILALAACGEQTTEAPSGAPIACALDGAVEFTNACRGEAQIVPGGSILVIRHPDGGFRRFEIEGEIVRTADGVEPTSVTVAPDATGVVVGSDRYRLPPPAPPVDAPKP